MDYVAFNLVIDDIVLPSGKTIMARLGGGGPQAAYGMRLWSARVALAGSVGVDFSETLWEELNGMGLELGGVRRGGVRRGGPPTPRAWQILEADGRRTQVWRVGADVLAYHLKRRIEDLPQPYRKGRGYHIGIHPLEPDMDFLSAVHALGGVVSVETFKSSERPLDRPALQALMKNADIFSMNALEAESLTGKNTWQEQLDVLFDCGARLVTLRLGQAGCLAADGRQVIYIPAVAVEESSPVGAGNAFCGGFLTGWVETQDISIAARRGVTAAALFLKYGYTRPEGLTDIEDIMTGLAGRVERRR